MTDTSVLRARPQFDIFRIDRTLEVNKQFGDGYLLSYLWAPSCFLTDSSIDGMPYVLFEVRIIVQL